ncbi:O-antigen ligase family protein [uncultured Amnibacterium sp.]|uniref:O-antigen ligase family protein n=1 Tax=uncultured Amnibacterium sp. TaxID=1631851 RepID=UPI0035CBC710
MRRQRARTVFAFAALFSLWDGDGVRDALSWWGFSAVSLVLLVLSVIMIVQERRALRRLLLSWSAVPVLAFTAICLLSTAWSNYPLVTALACLIQIGTSTIGLAVLLSGPPRHIVFVFGLMLHVHLVLALLFEVGVALSPAGQILPLWTNYGANVPGAYYWSQGLIFQGGRIQGIVANANLTCFIALLALILLAALVRARAIRPLLLIPAVVVDVLAIALTRSATVLIAGGLVLVTALIVLGYRRFGRRGRIALGVVAVGTVAAVGLGSSRLFAPLLRVLGKGDDFTGRFEIWRLVWEKAQERPALGWGWISYWAPWVDPYRRLVIRDGVQYLQAHNAYLDVVLQVGLPGQVALVAIVGSVVHRSLRLALVPAPYTALPLLLVVALLTQALAESRLLIEGNWALLVMLAVAVPSVDRSRAAAAALRAAEAPEDGAAVPAPAL